MNRQSVDAVHKCVGRHKSDFITAPNSLTLFVTNLPVSLASQSQTLLVYESVTRGFTILQCQISNSWQNITINLSSSPLKYIGTFHIQV